MQTQTQSWTQVDWTSALEDEARLLVEELDMHPAAQRLFQGRIDASGYIAWLVQTYHYVQWTTPLLEQAGHRLKRQGRHVLLAELLLQKASEERGHERWLLADLKNLGWTRKQVEATHPCRAVEAYIAWNRFQSEAGSPTAFLGTAFVLEYLSVHRAGQAVEGMLAHGAIPHIQKAVTFLRGHAGADGGHVAELMGVLRALTDPAEQAAILLSARNTRALYTGLFPEPEWMG
jgi:pyrroloquinoline quinone (PQQ) biosynthesis protein C